MVGCTDLSGQRVINLITEGARERDLSREDAGFTGGGGWKDAVGLAHVWSLPRVAAGAVGKAVSLPRARATRSILECTCIPAPLLSPQVLKVPLPSQRGTVLKASPTRELAENQERFALFGIN